MATKDDIIPALHFLHPDMGKGKYGVVELCAACPNAGKGSGLWQGFAGGKEGLVMGWYDDPAKLAAQAAELDAGWISRDGGAEYPKAIYVTLNPCDSALLGRSANRLKTGLSRTSDKDVGRIYNILIDVDARRPSGVSASGPEKKLAVEVTKRVRHYLMDDCFWPAPLIADSGNGGHLIFKVRFPDDMPAPDCAVKVKALLQALDTKFRTLEVAEDGREVEVGVDTTVFNPSRLVKLWGTWARKGDPTRERPHRKSKVIVTPDPGQSPVTLPMIETVLGLLGAGEEGKVEEPKTRGEIPTPRSVNNPFQPVAKKAEGGDKGRLDMDAYLETHQIKVVKVDDITDNGSTYKRWCLEKCVFDPSHGPNESFIGQTDGGKAFYKCFHQSCQGKKWKDVRAAISGEDKLGKFMVGGAGGDWLAFPHVNKEGKPYLRYENFVALCEHYGIEIRYNIMGKHEDVALPDGLWDDSDRLRTLARDYLEDLCGRHGLGSAKLDSWMRMLGEVEAYHPAKEWIESRPWDGVPRFEELVATVKTPTPEAWRTYLRRWLIQAIGALYEKKFCCRGVLTFTGAQGVGKTSWFKGLMPESLGAFGEGQSLDPADKDSAIITLSKWVVELGEVDATFRKADVSKLKAFLTREKDILRVPYGRAYDHWRRMTVFGATVNDPQFLMDGTGNTRWWCVETESINWRHGIDMQQLWAEAKMWWEAGETWFLNEGETEMLNRVNQTFEVIDPIQEHICEAFMFDTPREAWCNHMTTTQVLAAVNYDKPNRAQVIQAGVILKKLVGGQVFKRVNGNFGRYYCMPMAKTTFERVDNGSADDWLGGDNAANAKNRQ